MLGNLVIILTIASVSLTSCNVDPNLDTNLCDELKKELKEYVTVLELEDDKRMKDEYLLMIHFAKIEDDTMVYFSSSRYLDEFVVGSKSKWMFMTKFMDKYLIVGDIPEINLSEQIQSCIDFKSFEQLKRFRTSELYTDYNCKNCNITYKLRNNRLVKVSGAIDSN